MTLRPTNCPWGYFSILHEAADYKVKEIVINPHHRLSYQWHYKREEFWTIIEGNAKITLNDETHLLQAGSQIHIPKMAKHRIENPLETTLRIIEIQRGTYFGENDIVRIADDYNRI